MLLLTVLFPKFLTAHLRKAVSPMGTVVDVNVLFSNGLSPKSVKLPELLLLFTGLKELPLLLLLLACCCCAPVDDGDELVEEARIFPDEIAMARGAFSE